MSKRDLGSKLKARLDEWEAYGDQPLSAEEPKRDHATHRERGSEGSDLTERFALVPVSGNMDAVTIGPTDTVRSERQINELQAALEHERDQSRRLLDVVEREQVSHAVTLRKQTQRRSVPGTMREPIYWEPERPRASYNAGPGSSRHTYILLMFLTLVIGAASYGVIYLLIH